MLIKALIRRRSRTAKSAWIRLVERRNVENASAIHLTSEVEAVELERFGWRLPQRAVIPNGIDEPMPCAGRVSPDIEALKSGGPFILYLGRLSWKKGLDRLLHAFARSQAGKLAIVGTDDEAMAPQLRKLAAELRITNRICIIPRTVEGCEKEYLFAAARMFVLPSYSENFGNTVLEAMRRGVPVLTTPDVGAAEVVRQCGGGIVIEGDPEPFGKAIDQLDQNPELAKRMGESGQRHAMAHYGWSQIAARMEELYRHL
jgi:glycosyltransferase involved in cell wall biosynthesis